MSYICGRRPATASISTSFCGAFMQQCFLSLMALAAVLLLAGCGGSGGGGGSSTPSNPPTTTTADYAKA
jgi:hypothetical protein